MSTLGAVRAESAPYRPLRRRPCTRSLLESTGIGVSVGKLRRHPDWEVQSLAQRLVDVWKRQLAEHKQQKKAASSSSSSGFGGAGRR